MKKLFTICCLFMGSFFFAQEENIQVSPEGKFDKIFTRFGDELKLKDIAIGNPYKSQAAPENAILIQCNSGYFDLYFEIGSGMEGNSIPEQNRRAVICKVFEDLSNFIVMAPNTLNTRVNIVVKDLNKLLPGYVAGTFPAATSSIGGTASGYYVLPSGVPTIGGIIDNEIWKTINSGIDSYASFMSPLIVATGPGPGFYHGYVAFNFDNPSTNWHTALNLPTAAGLNDLYTVALHEITHALGFTSLINANGNSKLGSTFKYYTRYDQFLRTPSNQNLITNTGCSMYNWGFNPTLSPSVMVAPNPTASNCASQIKYVSSITQPVHTPPVFSDGSSLSHFEDQCPLPGHTNDQYFVMSDATPTGPSYMKRFLKPEERQVLCDIGYKVNSLYGSTANLSFKNYNTSQCSGIGVVGVNDGINPTTGAFQYVVTQGNSVNITNLWVNDIGSASFECLTDLYGNGTPSVTFGTNGTTVQYASTTAGLAVLRYVPVSASGVRGNITYIYIYVNTPGCAPSPCTILNNSGFENTSFCGTPNLRVNCWSRFSNSPDILSRTCNTSWYGIPTPTSIPSSDSWNFAPNNTFYGLLSHGDHLNTTPHYIEGIQSPLNFPLTNLSTYTISFRAKVANNYSSFLPLTLTNALSPSATGKISFAGASSLLAPVSANYTSLPSNLTQLGLQVPVTNDNNWHFYTQTFTYTGPNINNLIVLNSSNMNTLVGEPNVYIYVDDIEIVEVSPATTLTLPTVLCSNQTLPDLYFYAPVSGGVFSGSGVSSSGGVYSFSSAAAGVGTHTITYVYTNAINCVITIHQQIQVVSSTFSAQATASTQNACLGQNITLIGSISGNSTGPVTYTWNPGNLSGSTINTTFNGAPLYTFTATNTAGCVATAQVSVGTIPAPVVSVTPTSSTTCPSQPVLLTASGANTYTWSPTTGLSSSAGAAVNASPNSTTMYTVTGTNTSGCSATASSVVNIVPCPDCLTGTTISGTIGTNTFFTNLRIPNNLTISGTLTLIGSNVKILPGVTITVLQGATLNLNGVHLYGCQDMWNGIVVQNGGKVNIQPYTSGGSTKTTLIEDALIALDFQTITTQQASPVLTVNNATFNKNFVGIKVQGYAFANPSAVFSIKNSLFTCRNNIYNTTAGTWQLTNTVKAANNNTNPFLEPYILTTSFPFAQLKAPYSSLKADKGLFLFNVGTTTNTPVYNYNSLTIGSAITAEYNLFDNLKTGIHAQNSNLKVINSNFQYPVTINSFNFSNGIATGIAVTRQTSGDYKIDVAGTTAQPNRFYGMYRALYVYQYRNVQFAYNTIRSNRPVTIPISGYANGAYGVDMYLSNYDQVYVGYNTIYNISTGVHLNCATFGNSPTIQVSNNTFNRTLGTTTGGYATEAILIETLLSTPNISGTLFINNNTIAGGYKGITVRNWAKTNTQINSNVITIAGLTTYTASSHGISLENCTHSNAQIGYNTIKGFTQSAPNFRGIFLDISSGNIMNCNSVDSTYSGLFFRGNCNPTRTSNNSMKNHKYGFVLDGGGVIGQQGSPTAPADNKWLGTNWSPTLPANGLGNYKNACLNSSSTNFSIMYVRDTTAGSIYSPNKSIYNGFSSYSYSTALPNVTLFKVANPPLVASCTVPVIIVGPAFSQGEIISALVSSTDSSNASANVDQQAAVVNQSYRTLDADSTLLQNSVALNTFYTNTANSNTAKLLDVEKAVADGNLTLAASKNSSILTENSLEDSYQLFYDALINYEDDAFTETDSINLTNIASSCPTIEGGVVYQSNTLYNAVYNLAEVFTNVCPEYLDKSQVFTDESQIENQTNSESYRIFPIPNNGEFHLLGKSENGFKIEIVNLDGKLVFKEFFNEASNDVLVKTSIPSGTYTVVLKNSEGLIIYRNKIIVIQ